MRFRRAGIFTKIVILALVVYALISITRTKELIRQATDEMEILQAKVESAMQVNAELEYDLQHAADDKTIEDIARSKLGLVMPREKIFYDVSN